jgi:hypothetical protein
MPQARFAGALCLLLWTGQLVLAQTSDNPQTESLDNLYDDFDDGTANALGELLPPEPSPSSAPRSSTPPIPDETTATTLLGPPTLPPSTPGMSAPLGTPTTSAPSGGLQPIPAASTRRQSMANQPYTLAGILDDEDDYIDCLCEQEFCERMRQCASGQNRGWGLFRNWDLFWGGGSRNRDNSMQCWQCSARMQQQQMQYGFNSPYPQTPYGGGQPLAPGPGVPPSSSPPSGSLGYPSYPAGNVSYPPGASLPDLWSPLSAAGP